MFGFLKISHFLIRIQRITPTVLVMYFDLYVPKIMNKQNLNGF